MYALCRAERGIGRVSAAFDLHHDSPSRGKLNDDGLCLKGWTLTANETSRSFMTFIFSAHDQYICGIGDKVVTGERTILDRSSADPGSTAKLAFSALLV
jgi:hypothetical protein